MITSRVALVTGGTRGIGEAIAKRLGDDGFAVFISGRTERSIGAALSRFAKEGFAMRGFAADARNEGEQKRLVDSVADEAGRLDVLVNNAGLGHFAPVDQLSPAQFREVLETNLFGVYYAVHAAVPRMKANGGGFIINIASLAAVNPFAGGSAYNASKFGLLGFSEAAMLDVRARRHSDGYGPSGVGGDGVRALERFSRFVMDAPTGGRRRGGGRPGSISGPCDSLANRPPTVQAAEEVSATRYRPSATRCTSGGRAWDRRSSSR
jgi:NAD(P)-dependent dehydrogenase (short-subunit alcohol dehydrogenase family)